MRHPVEVTKMVWYYVKDGARQGPVEEAELRGLVAGEVIKSETLVWHEGMADWRPYSTVAPAPPEPVAPPPPAPVPDPAPTPAPVEPARESSPAAAVMASWAATAETAPVAVAPVAAAAGAPVAQPHYCSQCGRQYPSEELVRFGTATVCANCKEIYAQRIRETGQVAGNRIYGGFWIRFVAAMIDGVIMFIVSFTMGLVTSAGRFTSPNDLAAAFSTMGLSFFLSTAVAVGYEAFFLVNYGATPGKMAMGLKVITPDGGGISWGRAIGRYFAKFLSSITLLIGYIMAGFDSEKRALHDYVAGTRVILVR